MRPCLWSRAVPVGVSWGCVMSAVYGTSAVKPKRVRRTNSALAELDDAIVRAVAVEAPTTLRSVFYRCVSAGVVAKDENAYKTIGRRLVLLRKQGRVDYAHITDGTRWIVRSDRYDSVNEALNMTAYHYRRRLWSDQGVSLELFSEKDAIKGVVSPVARKWDIPLGVMRGYSSETFAWNVAQDLSPTKHNVLAQLGDHDPSGVGAWADFCKKVRGFAPDCSLEFVRLAVEEWQIEEWDLPTRPPKKETKKDREFGPCVEVDAIPPQQLRDLVEQWVSYYVDLKALRITEEAERSERMILQGLARRSWTGGDA